MSAPSDSNNQSLAEFVRRRIIAIFQDVAEEVGLGHIELIDDQLVGAPSAIFAASLYLEDAWNSYVKNTEAERRGGETDAVELGGIRG